MHLQLPFLPSLRRSVALPSALLLGALLCACAAPPASRSVVYDFGPGATQPVMSNRMAPLPPLVLADVEAPAALEGNAVLYRLAYADAQQLRPYAQARWTMPPGQLLRQRLREQLGQRRPVLLPADAVAPGTLVLRLELEEFSHYFESAQNSSGLVRVRATLSRTGLPARTLAQTSLVVQKVATRGDAAGGVQALAQASDALIAQLDAWVQQVASAESTTP
ncbi:ABC-type transport auxiliary lipoprotein family protein [Rhodoferax sp. GW822-FHT02A01]|uniref:ABC-type transport auxiliary lipoprotein family protein n=1 Tax=Rhodoferax sp. GW822-FHT02A01 TaxID=3141537 RepID=UPI00315C77D3